MTLKTDHNPDVLSCIANLSSDEVFTPPKVANEVLDLLPPSIWTDKHATFLDPCTKTGIFLREITRRLIDGLSDEIPDLQERINHILTNQVFGLAITELTGLLARRTVYCSKHANGDYSIAACFDDAQGNVKFERIEHSWHRGRCKFCGASEKNYTRGKELETHAYQFIHEQIPKEMRAMKFDVIIGNPPYQLSDGGAQASAMPIYNKFVEQAKKLNPRYLTMIIPSRWFSGGKGLSAFRGAMLADKRIRIIHDYLSASDCFPGISLKGGVCYFLWDRDNPGLCEVFTHKENEIVSEMERPLLEEDYDVFIRHNWAIEPLRKIISKKEESFSSQVSSRKPFGLPTNFSNILPTRERGSVKIYANKKTGFIHKGQILKNHEWIDKYKVYITMAYGAGEDFPHQIINKPKFGEKNTCCTETYLVIGPFDDSTTTKNVISYIQTKLCRFLVLLKKNTQDAARGVYQFVPMQDFSENWTDEKLYRKYGLDEKEIAFIETMIRPMDLKDE